MSASLLEQVHSRIERLYNLSTDRKMDDEFLDLLTLLEEAQEEMDELDFNGDRR